MFTLRNYKSILQNGITLKYDGDSKKVLVYNNQGFLKGTIYNNSNTIYFCGDEFVETTGKDIIDFFKTVYELR